MENFLGEIAWAGGILAFAFLMLLSVLCWILLICFWLSD